MAWVYAIGADTRVAATNTPNMSANTVYAWGAQVELGNVATPYMRTAALVTSALSNGMNDYSGTARIGFTFPSVAQANSRLLVSGGAGLFIYPPSDTNVGIYDNAAELLKNSGFSSLLNRTATLESWWNTPLATKSISVVNEASLTGSYDTSMIAPGTGILFIGAGSASSSGAQFGGITRNILLYKTSVHPGTAIFIDTKE